MLRVFSKLGRMLAALIGCLLVSVVSATDAHADDAASKYVVAGSVNSDGSINLKETITFDASAPETVSQRIRVLRPTGNQGGYLKYGVSDVEVTAGGKPLEHSTNPSSDYLTITVNTGGASEFTISYRVTGAAVADAVGDTVTVSWPVLQGLSVPVKQASGSLGVPGLMLYYDCQSGPQAAPGKCGMWAGGTHESQLPMFRDGPRGAGEVVNMQMRFPSASVSANADMGYRWSLDRAFSVGWLQLGLSLLTLIAGAIVLWLWHRRIGRDLVGTRIERIAEFAPAGVGVVEFNVLAEVRPGLVGTLGDERVDPIDVTATILDLAVRGYVRIHELPHENTYAKTDWEFERLAPAEPEGLCAYERTLLDAIAPFGKEARRVSALQEAVLGCLPQVQSEMYDECVERGWFARRPDLARNRGEKYGWAFLVIALILAIPIIWLTTFGLVAPVLLILAAGTLYVSQLMAARTAAGSSLLAGLATLSSDLASEPTDRMPAGKEYQELSEVLPYTVVLGSKDRWLNAIVAADGDEHPDPTDLNWYHAPDTWHLSDLPQSLDLFLTVVQGRLFSR